MSRAMREVGISWIVFLCALRYFPPLRWAIGEGW